MWALRDRAGYEASSALLPRGQISVPVRGIVAEPVDTVRRPDESPRATALAISFSASIFASGNRFARTSNPSFAGFMYGLSANKGHLAANWARASSPASALGPRHHDRVRGVEVFVGRGECISICFRVPGGVQYLRQHEVEEEGVPDVGDSSLLVDDEGAGDALLPGGYHVGGVSF